MSSTFSRSVRSKTGPRPLDGEPGQVAGLFQRPPQRNLALQVGLMVTEVGEEHIPAALLQGAIELHRIEAELLYPA